MCWCSKVFFRVSNNLMSRFCRVVSYQFYKMCCICWKPKYKPSATENNIYENVEIRIEPVFHESFYQDVNRETAEKMLQIKQNGTFIIRPTNIPYYVAIMSIVQDNRIYHLAVRRRKDGLLALGFEKNNERCFKNLSELINFYISNYIILQSNADTKKTHTLLIPFLG